jgi:hypothetical protein
MRFYIFLRGIDKNTDPHIHQFITWCNRQQRFPQTSSPAILGLFLRGKLNPQQALGYKKAMMLFFASPDNSLPKEFKDKDLFLQRLNIV